MEDQRFSQIAKDPKFRRIPKAQSKVKIDRRFQSMFTDKKFQVKYTTDKRGRPVKHHSTEDLKRYYEVSSDEEDNSSESDNETNKSGQFVRAPKLDQSEQSDENKQEGKKEEEDQLYMKDTSDKKLPDLVKKKLKDLNVDYARGEQTLYSDSSSDDEETDENLSESEDIDHRWGELDGDADRTEEATHRLAVCNLDWDRIRAVDLMVLLNSFLPPGGLIHSVAIYPSEFGKQRMKEEEIKGPIELVETKQENEAEETEDGSSYHMEKLRKYQLNRLKYYYAVITFDSPNSANKIYTECDGMEYESSATKIDLRFIPEDMTFDDTPKESCGKLPEKYEPRFFTTTALQQAKVELTWDETNPDRLEFAEKMNSGKIDDIAETDFQNYLAGSSSEDEDENSEKEDTEDESGNVIDKYKALLQDIEENEKDKKNKDVEMEISWGIDLKEKTDNLVKKRMENNEEKTPFQKYLNKKKEKRKDKRDLKKKAMKDDHSGESDIPSDIDINDPYFAEEFNNPEFRKKSKKNNKKRDNENGNEEEGKQKEAELALLLMNEEERTDKKHFSLKKIQEEESESKSKKKRKKQKKGNEDKAKNEETDFQVNVEDKRFSALFTSHHYNIDPTDPNFKKTKAMEVLIQEKIKRRNEDGAGDKEVKKAKKDGDSKKSRDVELNLLVKSVKRKAEAFKNK